MDGTPPERQAVGRRCYLRLVAVVMFSLPGIGFGQSSAVSGSQSAPTAVKFQILDQKIVSFGQHSVTLNRVVPPVFPVPVATPTPVPAIPSPQSPPPFEQPLFFSATVYDHQFTVVRWFDRNQDLALVSNLDFSYFTTYDFYEIFMGLDIESSADADPVTAGWLAQARKSLPANMPAYLIVSGSATADEIQELDAFHAYVAENSSNIVQAYQRQQEINAALALQLKLHPPVRPNTVINYWPIKSSVYLTGSNQ